MFNMSSRRSQDAYARLPVGLCTMWATIVLARLDAKLPSWDQALELEANRGGQSALRARHTFNIFALAFSDDHPGMGRTVLPTPVANSMLEESIRTASNYYQDSDREFEQLCIMLRGFHSSVHVNRPASLWSFALSMRESVNDLVSQLLVPSISEIAITVNTMAANVSADDLSPAVDEYIQTQPPVLSEIIEVFVRQQTSLILQGETDLCSDGFIDAIRAPLREHIREALNSFVAGSLSNASREIDMQHVDTQAMLSVFFHDVAQFFSYASPLLQRYWDPALQSSDSGDSDGTFIDDEDRVWYWLEYELTELEDVPTGPENVDIDGVSIPVTVLQPLTCPICIEPHTTVRQLKACRHTFCEECLTSQLQSRHPARYTCASCRARLLE